MSGFIVSKPGVLALLQDSGRYGYHHVGLTTGGPVDALAFAWANRLCSNGLGAVAIEVSVGGLCLQAQTDSLIAVTGAAMPLSINGQACELWRSYRVRAGDTIGLGFAASGCRSYLAVAGGFVIRPQFGSASTVVRESVGGLNGAALQQGQLLLCKRTSSHACYKLPARFRPHYGTDISVRTLATYQADTLGAGVSECFYQQRYSVSSQCDRMAYRLLAQNRPPVVPAQALYSEGIVLGAVQLPPDGQPIVMLPDRQTVGGYPKIATVLSTDMAKLGQLVAGNTVRFVPVSPTQARQQLLLSQQHFEQAQLVVV